MKYLLFVFPFLIGCNSAEDIVNKGYASLCNRQPESMSCVKHEYNGYYTNIDIVKSMSKEMYRNFTYMTDEDQYSSNEYWFDGELTSNKLIGDCDDISLTFISQLLIDGVKPSSIRFVASGIDGELKHYYVNVKLDDGTDFKFYHIKEYTDIMYMQYDNTGVFIDANQ